VLYKPFDIASTSIKATLSLGISLFPDNGKTSEELFKNADIAMYRAKKNGQNQICFFEDEMQHKFHNRVKTEAELRVAIEREEFQLYYQPVINSKNNKLEGFEALIRWNIDGEVRTPDKFMNIAEETRQILSMGFWVIEEAIAMLAIWNQKYNCSLTMAINVSAHQLSDVALVQHLSDCLKRHNVAAELIDIELTETALFKDTSETQDVIVGINDLNCRLSLDDFGTGFSSISHLRNYPITVVKIDKSLMPQGKDDLKLIALIESMVSMASILGLDIVAEGVETEYQLMLCKQFNIQHIQGYYFSPPLKQQDIEEKYLERLIIKN
jgi:predicted signal transduction protein with EAL and GGDEF domain